jgi:signal transduction histidine kinase
VDVRVSAAPVRSGSGAVEAAVTVVEELTLEKELVRLRERFISLVAHDLRNPLNAALTNLDLLRERLESGRNNLDTRGSPARLVDESLRTSEAIFRSMMRVSGMVSDLLDYSRLEAGQMAIHVGEVSLPGLVKELLEEMRPLLGGRLVEVDIDDDLPLLRADHGRLAQVLTNLLSNAMKYTPPGVRLGLRARRASAATRLPVKLSALELQRFVLLTAWDQGPGIPPEAQPRLFDPFYRLSRDQGKREGTGLGLFITRGLVEAHGGQVWIDDVPGASFSMLWPAAEPPGRDERDAQERRA